MRSSVLSVVAIFAMSSVVSVFAADTTELAALPMSGATDMATMNTGGLDTDTDTLSAAASLVPSAGSSLGEYKSVSCTSNSAFGVNNCNQCFDGGSVKVGERLTGLFDNWTNIATTPLIAYQDEQKTPNMVKFGNTTWTMNPASEAGIWKFSSDVVWTSGSGAKSSFMVPAGTKVKFYESDINAGYTLEKTDKKNGEMVGMLRFPVVSRVVNMATATEGQPETHYECVAYKLAATPAAPVTPPTTPAPTPKEMTKTETGPETLLLIAAAFFIAFGLMFTLRKRA